MILQLFISISLIWAVASVATAIVCPLLTGDRLEPKIFAEAIGLVYVFCLLAGVFATAIAFLIL